MDAHTAWLAGELPRHPVRRPTPSIAHLQDAPLQAGPGYLQSLFRRFLRRLEPRELTDLTAWLMHLSANGGMSFGSICSGSDAPVLVLNAFFDVMATDYQIPMHGVDHCFACERSMSKANFLNEVWADCQHCFRNAEDMGQELAFEWRSRGPKRVGPVDVLMAGFPCTDNSRLNAHSGLTQNKTCLARGDMNSGSAFAGILAHLKNHDSAKLFAIFENTPGLATPPVDSKTHRPLGPDNLSTAGYLLDRAGFVLKAFQLTPLLFGVPQSRQRFWMPCFRRIMLEARGLDAEEANRILDSVMDRCVGSMPMDLEAFLLPETSTEVIEYLRNCAVQRHIDDGNMNAALASSSGLLVERLATGLAAGQKRKAAPPQWPVKHWEAAGLAWLRMRPFNDSDYLCFPGLSALSHREAEVLQLMGVRLPEKPGRIIELSQSYGRNTAMSSVSPAVTPSGRRFSTSRGRLLLAEEDMRLQCMFFPGGAARDRVSRFPPKLLRDLAGNAFESSCCAATLLSCLVVCSHGQSQ